MSHLDYIKDVEQALETLGANPKAAKAGLPGSWIVQKGSASITITLNTSPSASGEQKTIVLSARMMNLPRKKQRELFARLLELNRSFVSERFEIYDEGVFLTSARHLAGITPPEIVMLINDLAETADFWDDKLISEFQVK